MKQMITVQHTQSVHHTNGMVGSWTDWDLTPLGIEQAKRIGAHLKEQLAGQQWVIYTSDLLRARRTAGIIGDCLGVTPIHHVALRERNLGCAIGKSVQWLQANCTANERTVDDRLFPDAESRRDAWNRLKPFFEQLMDSGDERIILVSHGDLLTLLYSMWLGMDVTALHHAGLSGMPGGVSLLEEWENGQRVIRRLNDTSYLL
ncbi:MAG: histidine phosphatase family protein [Aristaeellaceae bacterium]